MSTKLYLTGDTGPSGFGVATRYVLKYLLLEDPDDFEVTARTHFWGLNREGIKMQTGGFPDSRFREWLLKTDTVNEDYLIDDPRALADRDDNLTDNLGTNETIDPSKCIVRQFEGPEDVWLAIGGASFADQAPDHAYSILSTDFNLDLVPRDWEYYLDQVDEMWVPSEWTRDAVLDRVGDEHREKVRCFPYGIPMDYEPCEYDCEVCQHNRDGVNARPPQASCLRDDATTFGMVSRWYHIKGIYRTLRAYVEEFRQSDDVRLFIKTTSNQQFQFDPAQATSQLITGLGYPDAPEIGFATEPLETQHMYNLLGEFDAFLQPSRAECFGIAQLQAAYCGTPVVYTDWSAQRELLDSRNEGFIPIRQFSVETPQQEFPFLPFDVHNSYPPDAHWAVPSIEELQQTMRDIYRADQQTLDRRGQQARQYVEENYQWTDRIGQRIDRLREVAP